MIEVIIEQFFKLADETGDFYTFLLSTLRQAQCDGFGNCQEIRLRRTDNAKNFRIETHCKQWATLISNILLGHHGTFHFGSFGSTITDFSRSTVTNPAFALRGLRTYFRSV